MNRRDLGDLQRWRRRADPLLDPAIALAAFLLSIVPLRDDQACGCTVPTWAYVLLVLQAAPLAGRRRWPFALGLLSGAATFVYGLTDAPDSSLPYAGLVALYSAAAHASRLKARSAGVIAAVAIMVAIGVDWPNADLEDAWTNYLVFVTAWLLGDGARTRRERAAALEARVEESERLRRAEAEAAVEAERARIAREMHDIVAHHVSMMVVQAEAGAVSVERAPPRAVQAFDDISSTGRAALAEMRRLLGVLRRSEPAERAPQPDLDGVPELVAAVRSTGTDARLTVTGDPAGLPPTVSLSAYRVVQEALTNVVRHAGRDARVEVDVAVDDEAVRIEVRDDGRGTVPSPVTGAGQGLVAMGERVTLVGGTLTAGPVEGGWRVRAELPREAGR